jgi:hypothetical protein
MKKTIIVIVAIVILAYVLLRPKVEAPIDNAPVAAISGDTGNFISFSIAPGAKVSGHTSAVGSIKGAYFFEANAVGKLLDANKNVLKSFPITAVGDWMTADAVAFNTEFDASGITGPGYIRIANDNPSGLPENDRFIDIPVVFE